MVRVPTFYRQDSPECGRVWIDDDFNDRVAEVDVAMLGPESALRAGQLLSAAPDMLFALEMMVEKFANDVLEGESGYDALCCALSAIAKAKGE